MQQKSDKAKLKDFCSKSVLQSRFRHVEVFVVNLNADELFARVCACESRITSTVQCRASTL